MGSAASSRRRKRPITPLCWFKGLDVSYKVPGSRIITRVRVEPRKKFNLYDLAVILVLLRAKRRLLRSSSKKWDWIIDDNDTVRSMQKEIILQRTYFLELYVNEVYERSFSKLQDWIPLPRVSDHDAHHAQLEDYLAYSVEVFDKASNSDLLDGAKQAEAMVVPSEAWLEADEFPQTITEPEGSRFNREVLECGAQNLTYGEIHYERTLAKRDQNLANYRYAYMDDETDRKIAENLYVESRHRAVILRYLAFLKQIAAHEEGEQTKLQPVDEEESRSPGTDETMETIDNKDLLSELSSQYEPEIKVRRASPFRSASRRQRKVSETDFNFLTCQTS